MQPEEKQSVRCSVEDSGKLPPELRAAGAICDPIERAVHAAAANSSLALDSVSVKVKVVTPYLLAVSMTVEGQDLPEQKLGSSDRALTRGSIERLAAGVARRLGDYAAARR